MLRVPHLLVVGALLISFGPCNSLKCHEGFNVSISGIPMYYWAEHECAKESECFIQRISVKFPETKFKDFVLRYGGCVSKNFARYMTCEQLFGEDSSITVDTVFDILRGLDVRTRLFIKDILGDDIHLELLLSGGNDPDEFLSGILDFLESIGYDRRKINGPLSRLVSNLDDDEQLWKNWLSLAEAAKITTDGTERLSRTLKPFSLQLFDGPLPKSVEPFFSSYTPGLVYPILLLFLDRMKVDEAYTAIANGLESMTIDGPERRLPEEEFFVFLQCVLVIICEREPQQFHHAYELIKSTMKGYKVLDNSSVVEKHLKIAETISDYSVEYKSLPICAPLDFSCQAQNEMRKMSIRLARRSDFERALRLLRVGEKEKSHDSKPGGRKTKIGDNSDILEVWKLSNETLFKLEESFFNWMRQLSKNPKPVTFADLFDRLQPIVKMKMDIYYKNAFRRTLLSPDTCDHLACTKNLCNSHSALLYKMDTGKSRLGKREL